MQLSRSRGREQQHAHEMREAARLHLRHHAGTVDLDRVPIHLADSYARAEKPSVLKRNARASRAASSSSITWTTGSVAIGELLRSDTPQREPENRSAGRIGLYRDLPAMGFDDGARDGQPNPHALPLRRYERLEQP